ncbi:DUF4397 domain-containing protein [Chitinophaga sp. YIM B06452]|uniref:DUF4397 domain-containing protein n=1 Tax=Chitinophaga sp. YIM B06452 TaxID=3082158 RepID=UPI0031FEB4DB
MKKKIHIPALVLVLLAGACSREAEIPAAEPVTYATFYNGSPDFYEIPNYVSLNNDSTLMLSYNGSAGGSVGALNYAVYQMLRPGTYRVSFSDAGDYKDKLTDNLVNMQPGKHQTVFLADSLGYFEAIASEDDTPRDPAMAQVRLIHLSPDARPVSMMIDLTAVPGLDSVKFKQITPFAKVPPDPNPGFRIRYNDNGMEKTLVRKSFALLPGRSYTFILRGYVRNGSTNPNKGINLSALITQ